MIATVVVGAAVVVVAGQVDAAALTCCCCGVLGLGELLLPKLCIYSSCR
jgi:hypothetical protein